MDVIWAPAALADLHRIRTYIGHFNPAAARRMGFRLVEAGDSLAAMPERGRPIGRGRRELVAVWPYVIRYQVRGESVWILRIRHGRQLPPA